MDAYAAVVAAAAIVLTPAGIAYGEFRRRRMSGADAAWMFAAGVAFLSVMGFFGLVAWYGIPRAWEFLTR